MGNHRHSPSLTRASSRTRRPPHASSPSRACSTRTLGVNESRLDYHQGELHKSPRLSHGISSRNPRVPESRLDYNQGELYHSFRQSHGISSRNPHVPEPRPDDDQGEPHHSSRQSHGISSRNIRVPVSRLDYHQGGPHHSSRQSHGISSRAPWVLESRPDQHLIQARPRVDSRRNSHTTRSTSTGERENSPLIGSGADNGIRPRVDSHRTGESGNSQPIALRSDRDDVENRPGTGPSTRSDYVPVFDPRALARGIFTPFVPEEIREYVDPEEAGPSRHVSNQDSLTHAGAVARGIIDPEESPETRRWFDPTFDYEEALEDLEGMETLSAPFVPEETLPTREYFDPEEAGPSRHVSNQDSSTHADAVARGIIDPEESPEERRWFDSTFDYEESLEYLEGMETLSAPFVPEGTLPTREYFDPEEAGPSRHVSSQGSLTHADAVARGIIDPEERRWLDSTFNYEEDNYEEDSYEEDDYEEDDYEEDVEYFEGFPIPRRWFDSFDLEEALEYLEGIGPLSDTAESFRRHLLAFDTLSDEDEDEPPRRHLDIYHIPPDPYHEPSGSRRRRERRAMVDNLLARFPQIDTTTFAEDDRSCPICTDQYVVPTAATGSESDETEYAILPPCLHLIGRNCLRRWLGNGKSTCPMCRMNLLR